MARRPGHGWASVTVLTREQAARTEAFTFVPAVQPLPAAAAIGA